MAVIKETSICKAVAALYSDVVTVDYYSIDNYTAYDANGDEVAVVHDDVVAWAESYEAGELPMLVLRQERDFLIAQTDWWAGQDRTMSQAEIDYRAALRDLPANSPNVGLDANGKLTGVTWPTKPE